MNDSMAHSHGSSEMHPSPPPPPPFPEHHVDIAIDSYLPGCEIDDSCYSPATIEVGAGQDVVWTNQDGLAHTVTSGAPFSGPSALFDSGIMAQGATYVETFEAAGTFDYYCTLHPWMTGAVVVVDDAGGHPAPADGGTPPAIPDWVRNNAGWWAEGKIDDSVFAQGIEFLIKEGIVRVPEGAMPGGASDGAAGDVRAQVIPDWVRNNAGWWADGMISDLAFLDALGWMITNGAIRL